jgi:hypothetical protein
MFHFSFKNILSASSPFEHSTVWYPFTSKYSRIREPKLGSSSANRILKTFINEDLI